MAAGRVFLADFGLAKDTATGSRYTRTGVSIGTPAYMSPEQARGESAALTPASDVWALAAVAYELLAGRRAFEGDTTAAVIGAVLTRPPRRPRGAPRAVWGLLSAGLAPAAGERPPQAAAFAADCTRVLAGRPPLHRRRRPPGPAVAVAAVAIAVVAVAVLAAGRGDPASARATGLDSARALAQRARALRASDPAGAAEHLRRALALAPDEHAWRLEYGLLRWAVGDGAAATAAWAAIPASAPERASAQLWSAVHEVYRFDGQRLVTTGGQAALAAATRLPGREGAIARAMQAAVAADWSNARRALGALEGWEAWLLRGCVEQEDPAGDAATAVRLLDRALAEGLPFAWVLLKRALAKSHLGDFAGCEADCTLAWQRAPSFSAALAVRARARDDRGDAAGALADVEAAIALGPPMADWHMHRGNLRDRGGDYAGAVADYDAAIILDPGHANAYANRAHARVNAGDAAGAAADFEATLRLAPGHFHAHFGRGALRQAAGDLAGAEADYGAAVAAKPDYVQAWNNRGGVRMRLGRFAEALADFDEVLRRQPEHLGARSNRGVARWNLGDLPGAIADLRQARALQPADTIVLRNLAAVLDEHGDAAEAAAVRRALAALEARAKGGG